MSVPPSGEALRERVLAVLVSTGDERARAAVEGGAVTIASEVTRWESSRGGVSGYRVRLDLPAGVLAQVGSNPVLVDLLQAAFATAMASLSDDAVVDLELRWAPLVFPSPYRDSTGPTHSSSPITPLAFRAALDEYLRALGLDASSVARAAIDETRGRFVIQLNEEDALAVAAIRRAVASLLGPDVARVRVGSAAFLR